MQGWAGAVRWHRPFPFRDKGMAMIVLVFCGFIGACCGIAGVKGLDA